MSIAQLCPQLGPDERSVFLFRDYICTPSSRKFDEPELFRQHLPYLCQLQPLWILLLEESKRPQELATALCEAFSLDFLALLPSTNYEAGVGSSGASASSSGEYMALPISTLPWRMQKEILKYLDVPPSLRQERYDIDVFESPTLNFLAQECGGALRFSETPADQNSGSTTNTIHSAKQAHQVNLVVPDPLLYYLITFVNVIVLRTEHLARMMEALEITRRAHLGETTSTAADKNKQMGRAIHNLGSNFLTPFFAGGNRTLQNLQKQGSKAKFGSSEFVFTNRRESKTYEKLLIEYLYIFRAGTASSGFGSRSNGGLVPTASSATGGATTAQERAGAKLRGRLSAGQRLLHCLIFDMWFASTAATDSSLALPAGGPPPIPNNSSAALLPKIAREDPMGDLLLNSAQMLPAMRVALLHLLCSEPLNSLHDFVFTAERVLRKILAHPDLHLDCFLQAMRTWLLLCQPWLASLIYPYYVTAYNGMGGKGFRKLLNEKQLEHTIGLEPEPVTHFRSANDRYVVQATSSRGKNSKNSVDALLPNLNAWMGISRSEFLDNLDFFAKNEVANLFTDYHGLRSTRTNMMMTGGSGSSTAAGTILQPNMSSSSSSSTPGAPPRGPTSMLASVVDTLFYPVTFVFGGGNNSRARGTATGVGSSAAGGGTSTRGSATASSSSPTQRFFDRALYGPSAQFFVYGPGLHDDSRLGAGGDREFGNVGFSEGYRDYVTRHWSLYALLRQFLGHPVFQECREHIATGYHKTSGLASVAALVAAGSSSSASSSRSSRPGAAQPTSTRSAALRLPSSLANSYRQHRLSGADHLAIYNDFLSLSFATLSCFGDPGLLQALWSSQRDGVLHSMRMVLDSAATADNDSLLQMRMGVVSSSTAPGSGYLLAGGFSSAGATSVLSASALSLPLSSNSTDSNFGRSFADSQPGMLSSVYSGQHFATANQHALANLFEDHTGVFTGDIIECAKPTVAMLEKVCGFMSTEMERKTQAEINVRAAGGAKGKAPAGGVVQPDQHIRNAQRRQAAASSSPGGRRKQHDPVSSPVSNFKQCSSVYNTANAGGAAKILSTKNAQMNQTGMLASGSGRSPPAQQAQLREQDLLQDFEMERQAALFPPLDMRSKLYHSTRKPSPLLSPARAVHHLPGTSVNNHGVGVMSSTPSFAQTAAGDAQPRAVRAVVGGGASVLAGPEDPNLYAVQGTGSGFSWWKKLFSFAGGDDRGHSTVGHVGTSKQKPEQAAAELQARSNSRENNNHQAGTVDPPQTTLDSTSLSRAPGGGATAQQPARSSSKGGPAAAVAHTKNPASKSRPAKEKLDNLHLVPPKLYDAFPRLKYRLRRETVAWSPLFNDSLPEEPVLQPSGMLDKMTGGVGALLGGGGGQLVVPGSSTGGGTISARDQVSLDNINPSSSTNNFAGSPSQSLRKKYKIQNELSVTEQFLRSEKMRRDAMEFTSNSGNYNGMIHGAPHADLTGEDYNSARLERERILQDNLDSSLLSDHNFHAGNPHRHSSLRRRLDLNASTQDHDGEQDEVSYYPAPNTVSPLDFSQLQPNRERTTSGDVDRDNYYMRNSVLAGQHHAYYSSPGYGCLSPDDLLRRQHHQLAVYEEQHREQKNPLVRRTHNRGFEFVQFEGNQWQKPCTSYEWWPLLWVLRQISFLLDALFYGEEMSQYQQNYDSQEHNQHPCIQWPRYFADCRLVFTLGLGYLVVGFLFQQVVAV
ncbi:unnamed protein product [Amoebophrya sp. A120]|nr:unnamed protein product [Amoebophrya sp. A120]|eukprot:GSA120T00021513001.1